MSSILKWFRDALIPPSKHQVKNAEPETFILKMYSKKLTALIDVPLPVEQLGRCGDYWPVLAQIELQKLEEAEIDRIDNLTPVEEISIWVKKWVELEQLSVDTEALAIKLASRYDGVDALLTVKVPDEIEFQLCFNTWPPPMTSAERELVQLLEGFEYIPQLLVWIHRERFTRGTFEPLARGGGWCCGRREHCPLFADEYGCCMKEKPAAWERY